MPSLFEIQKENEIPASIKKYVEELSKKTNRNVNRILFWMVVYIIMSIWWN